MLELGQNLPFAAKTPEIRCAIQSPANDLYGYLLPVFAIFAFGEVYSPHASVGDLAHHTKRTELSPFHQFCRRIFHRGHIGSADGHLDEISRLLVCSDQRIHFIQQSRIAGAEFRQEPASALGINIHDGKECIADLLPATSIHHHRRRLFHNSPYLQWTSRYSQARARLHSRSAVASDLPMRVETSFIVSPPKNRNSTIRLFSGSINARLFSASLSANMSRSSSLGEWTASSSEIFASGPRLAALCASA